MYVLEIIEKSADWGYILPGNFIFTWLKNANFWEPCKKNILMMKPELTYISKHFLCQIHNFLRGTWTLDGSIRKTKHGISFRHSLQGREGLLEVLHVVVAHHRWVSFKCFWKTLDLKKKNDLSWLFSIVSKVWLNTSQCFSSGHCEMTLPSGHATQWLRHYYLRQNDVVLTYKNVIITSFVRWVGIFPSSILLFWTAKWFDKISPRKGNMGYLIGLASVCHCAVALLTGIGYEALVVFYRPKEGFNSLALRQIWLTKTDSMLMLLKKVTLHQGVSIRACHLCGLLSWYPFFR